MTFGAIFDSFFCNFLAGLEIGVPLSTATTQHEMVTAVNQDEVHAESSSKSIPSSVSTPVVSAFMNKPKLKNNTQTIPVRRSHDDILRAQ